MTRIHFLNVKEGDCTIIQHESGNCSMIDVCNARKNEVNEQHDLLKKMEDLLEQDASALLSDIKGNFNMKAHPTNPIEYMKIINIQNIFRYIQTHPDMDHMDGLRDIYEEFKFINFWDTYNDRNMDKGNFGQYREEDWKFYQSIRKSKENPKSLMYYAKSKNKFYNLDINNMPDGDGIHILAPTREIIEEVKKTNAPNYNDCSYVLLLKSHGRKILFGGDSADLTWNYILNDNTLVQEISKIDILIAPHHGRMTGGDEGNKYLDVLQPKLTFFGNAQSNYLNYDTWCNKKLKYITNNQAGNIIVDITDDGGLTIYCENKEYAQYRRNPPMFNSEVNAYFITVM